MEPGETKEETLKSAQDGVADRGWNDPPPINTKTSRGDVNATKRRLNRRVPIPDTSVPSMNLQFMAGGAPPSMCTPPMGGPPPSMNAPPLMGGAQPNMTKTPPSTFSSPTTRD